MTGMNKYGVFVCACAGSVTAAAFGDEAPAVLDIEHAQVRAIAHIYYHVASGERVITLADDQAASADAGGATGSIWATLSNPCVSVDPGFATSFFYVADDNSGSTSLSTGITTLELGDIMKDTVVDCVRIEWVTDHDDVDSDSDGIGDGVIGLAGQWTWWDAYNGRAIDMCTRQPLISFIFTNLPGDLDPSPDFVAVYTADIDLSGTFSSSLVFEFGDSDSDLQGAAVHNADISNQDNNFDGLPDSDLDGDGLFDWAWDVRFYQPGTADLDGDGVLDGDLSDSMRRIGMTTAAPAGTAIELPDGTWIYDIDTSLSDAGRGSIDQFELFDGDVQLGSFNFGGFSCTPGLITPWGGFGAQLFGPSGFTSCPGDVNGDGELNFFDISGFIVCYQVRAPCGDINGDGDFTFFDVSAFLAFFMSGCP